MFGQASESRPDSAVQPVAEAASPAPARYSAPSSGAGRLAWLAWRVPTAAGLVILTMIVVAVVFAPLVAPYDPFEMHVRERLAGPSFQYLMGTDETGRDLLSNLLYAGRISLLVGIGAEAIAILLGLPLGLIAGTRPGLADDAIMRLLDGLLAFPGILLALTIVGLFGTSMQTLLAAIGTHLHAARRPDRAGVGPGGARQGLRAGRVGARSDPGPDHGSAHFAELPVGTDRSSVAWDRAGDPHRGIVELSGAGRPATGIVVGPAALGRVQLHHHRRLVRDLPWPVHLRHRLVLERARRRRARRTDPRLRNV